MKYIFIILLFTISCAKSQSGFLGYQKVALHSLFQPMPGALALNPTSTWESNQNLEATMFYDSSTSNIKIYFTGSADSTNPSFNNRIGLATTTDLINFTKSASNPIIGQGNGGAATTRRAHSSWVGKVGSTYYAFATNGYGMNYTGEDRNIYGYTSTDGITWTDLGIIFNKTTAYPGHTLVGFGNIGICTDQFNNPKVINGKYSCLMDAFDGTIWVTYRAEATAITGPWTITNPAPSLSVISGKLYGGASVIYSNGFYHAFYHYGTGTGGSDPNLPTYLAYATSTDCINWTIKEAPFMKIEASPYTATDQIADPNLCEINGNTYMVAEYVHNPPGAYKAQVRIWKFPGTFDQLVKAIQ